jgi:hypothetical protein
LSVLLVQSILHGYQVAWSDTTGLRWTIYSFAALLKVALLAQFAPEIVTNPTAIFRVAAHAAAVNSGLAFAQILYPELTRLIDTQIVILSDDAQLASLDIIRPRGLSSFGGASLSAYLATLLSLLWISSISSTIRPQLLDYPVSIVLFAGVIASGRTGIAIVLVGTLFLLLQLLQNASVRRFLSIGILLTSFAVITSLGIAALTLSSTDTIEAGLSRAFEAVVRYESEGQVRISSLDGVVDQLEAVNELPRDATALLLGTGNYGRSDVNQYVASDSGYVRLAFGAGLIGTILWMSVSLAAPLKALGRIQSPRIAPAFLLLTCILINIKEPFLLGSPGFGFLLACFLLAPVAQRSLPNTASK